MSHFTKRAAELTTAAYNCEVNKGLTALVVDGRDIVEMSAQGCSQVVGNFRPKQRVVNEKFEIR